ncbi:hypothetical protein SAMN05216337_1001194 [Bradyrhizobium brasilense]|uniref:Uncharacterized protein n=1 Tax=Bradyrhizobium brasilense TaxID=1419277 RepID=A0A1G6IPC5_9BRAD|nr:hypothetical protein [Bradyrhizobium brasilense]SDC07616.1 hypothetical protein SAMN05216337_1001194 [Bradyrhizobium brasilense]
MKKVAKKRIVEKRVAQTCAEATNRRSKFKLGDVVMLVTGSFPMVVSGIEKGSMIRLVWCNEGRSWLEHYSGVVAFEPLSLGREAVMLGRVQVGEIMPAEGEHAKACFRLRLPDASATAAWWPVADIAEARRLAAIKINDWMNAAGVVPAGRLS